MSSPPSSSCNFSRYLFLSILISSITVVYLSKHVVPNIDIDFESLNSDLSPIKNSNSFLTYYIRKVVELTETYLNTKDSISLLVFINVGFCNLYFWGTVMIKIFFGQLRDIESQFMYDRLLNFLLFKVVFVGAIIEPSWIELYLWVTWFTAIGFLRLFGMCGRDRVEYLTHSPSTSKSAHIRTFSFLCVILLASIIWSFVCLSSFKSMLFLLAFECLTLILETVQTLVKYCIHLKDLYSEENWEYKDIYVRRTEFYLDSAILLTTLCHYIQVAWIRGLSFSLIDAVLFLNVRSILKTLRRKYIIYKNYLKALNEMDTRFPSLTKTELSELQDPCPICRDEMLQGKKLPCNHCFHSSCLRLWVESHDSCPVCRVSLSKFDTESNARDKVHYDLTSPSTSNFSSRPPSFPSSPRAMFQTTPLNPSSESNIDYFNSQLRSRSRNPSFRDLQSLVDFDDFTASTFRSLFSDDSLMNDSDPFDFNSTSPITQDLPLAEVVDQMQRFNP